jgi:hypothetical protein
MFLYRYQLGAASFKIVKFLHEYGMIRTAVTTLEAPVQETGEIRGGGEKTWYSIFLVVNPRRTGVQ